MSESLRVLLIVNEFPPEKIAGTAMATQALADRLSERGHEVMVVVTTPCPLEKQDQIVSGNYELVWLSKRPLRGMGMFWRIWHTWKHAKRFGPQLIQGQAVSCGLVAAVVGRWLKVPSICYAQGYDVYQASAWQKRTEIRWGCRCTDRLLAVTEHLAEAIRQTVGELPLQIMPHAFALPDKTPDRSVARENFGLADDSPMVLSVGRIELFKGHDVLLNVWPRILSTHAKAELWITGVGSRHDDLMRQAERLGIAASVKFVGHLKPEKVHSMMAAADLFVLPSRSEPFGIVLLEAMAHALPVVASRIGGIPEVVPDGEVVPLVPVEDENALADAMLSELHVPFQPLPEYRDHAMTFEWDEQVQRFESIYREMVNDSDSE
ncbi:glycosyltransferase family 4 protein [Thermodesulfobacteriota bacterium]